MTDILISTVLSVVIAVIAVLWQQPVTATSGIINVVVVFFLTYIIYYAIKYVMYSSRTRAI